MSTPTSCDVARAAKSAADGLAATCKAVDEATDLALGWGGNDTISMRSAHAARLVQEARAVLLDIAAVMGT